MDFDPYHMWLGIQLTEQPPNYYRLLGISMFESNATVIDHAADRQMAFLRSFQLGTQRNHCQRLLNEVAAARLCLLDAQKKAAYDENLRAELGRTTPPPARPAITPVVRSPQEVSIRQPSASRNRRRHHPIAAILGVGTLILVIGAVLVSNLGRPSALWKPQENKDRVQRPIDAALQDTEALPEAQHSINAQKVDGFEKPPSAPRSEEYVDLPIVENSIGMKLVQIPAGEYLMGSSLPDDRLMGNGPQHKVHITSPFFTGQTEVTQAQYQRIAGTNPSTFQGDNKPVENISFGDAIIFCRLLSELDDEKRAGRAYRLPTEAEWEYACRAGTQTDYHFGNADTDAGNYAWYRYTSDLLTQPVMMKKPNAWTLYDMCGNVNEYCLDVFGREYYASSPVDDPIGPSIGQGQVVRGGSWMAPVTSLRSASRQHHAGDSGVPVVGLRVVMTQDPVLPLVVSSQGSSPDANGRGEIALKIGSAPLRILYARFGNEHGWTNSTRTLQESLNNDELILAPLATFENQRDSSKRMEVYYRFGNEAIRLLVVDNSRPVAMLASSPVNVDDPAKSPIMRVFIGSRIRWSEATAVATDMLEREQPTIELAELHTRCKMRPQWGMPHYLVLVQRHLGSLRAVYFEYSPAHLDRTILLD